MCIYEMCITTRHALGDLDNLCRLILLSLVQTCPKQTCFNPTPDIILAHVQLMQAPLLLRPVSRAEYFEVFSDSPHSVGPVLAAGECMPAGPLNAPVHMLL